MDAHLSRASRFLKYELQQAHSTNESLIDGFERLTPSELAELFVNASFFRAVLQPLIDQDWLRKQRNDVTELDQRPKQMERELRLLSFLSDEILAATSKQFKIYFNRTTHLLHVLVAFAQVETQDAFRQFSSEAMQRMSALACDQASFAFTPFSEAMYRAFDQFDEILGIRYELDLSMASLPSQRERLFEGAGLGVQTSYSSILLALARARVGEGARVMDLGSGYGRVGFVLGLLRPDVTFTGVEYVPHRVDDSRAVALRAGLSSVDFVAGDLAVVEIPFADVYYMYDPFCRETYARVLERLISYARHSPSPITIITKGRANTWVRDALMGEGWSVDETCDSGTVCLFTSEPLSHSETA